MNWSYGITTVPQRITDTLPRTIESLASAGFKEPRLFVDGWYGEPQFMGCPVTTRDTPIKLVGSWMAGMWELYTRNPTAHRFAMFQDDILSIGNLKKYLEWSKYPKAGYLNLYTFTQNTHKDHKEIGWHPSNQRGMGALGLVFDRDTLVSLLRSGHLARKPIDAHSTRSWKALDGGIVSGLKEFKIHEYIHNPTLLQHTGTEHSALGNSVGGKPYGENKSFPGENKDAMDYLAKDPPTWVPEPGDDPITRAIEMIGREGDRVKRWMAEGCGNCADSRRKRAKIGAWASRVLQGKTEKAQEYLEKILED